MVEAAEGERIVNGDLMPKEGGHRIGAIAGHDDRRVRAELAHQSVKQAVTAELAGGADAPVVLTGSGAAAMAALLRHKTSVDDTLTLRGLWLLWRANHRA